MTGSVAPTPHAGAPAGDVHASGTRLTGWLAGQGLWMGVVALALSWAGIGGLVGILGGPLSTAACVRAGSDPGRRFRRLAITGVVLNALAVVVALAAFVVVFATADWD